MNPSRARAGPDVHAVSVMVVVDRWSRYVMAMVVLESIISNRGSNYAVSGGTCQSDADARTFIADRKRDGVTLCGEA